jgi:transposase InsO family protein
VNKNNALEAISKYKAAIENQTNLTIKKLISDGGGKFVSRALSEILDSAGIKHVVLPPYTPQHNGYAEQANRTVIEMTRTMMMQANLAPKWWGEAFRTACGRPKLRQLN